MNDNWNRGNNKGHDIAQKFLEEINAHMQIFKHDKDYLGGFQVGILSTVGQLTVYENEFFCGNTEDM